MVEVQHNEGVKGITLVVWGWWLNAHCRAWSNASKMELIIGWEELKPGLIKSPDVLF